MTSLSFTGSQGGTSKTITEFSNEVWFKYSRIRSLDVLDGWIDATLFQELCVREN